MRLTAAKVYPITYTLSHLNCSNLVNSNQITLNVFFFFDQNKNQTLLEFNWINRMRRMLYHADNNINIFEWIVHNVLVYITVFTVMKLFCFLYSSSSSFLLLENFFRSIIQWKKNVLSFSLAACFAVYIRIGFNGTDNHPQHHAIDINEIELNTARDRYCHIFKALGLFFAVQSCDIVQFRKKQ